MSRQLGQVQGQAERIFAEMQLEHSQDPKMVADGRGGGGGWASGFPG